MLWQEPCALKMKFNAELVANLGFEKLESSDKN